MRIQEHIEELKRSLSEDAGVRLLHFGIFPGIALAEIENIEREFFPLPEGMKQLYTYSNGLVVVWENKDDKPTEWPGSNALSNPDWEWTLNSYQLPRGVINILPLNEIFYHDWQDVIWFDGDRNVADEQLEADAFKRSVKPFDLYSKYNSVCLFSMDGKEAVCALGDDHNADFESYKPLEMEKYLEKLFQTKGEQAARIKFFKEVS